MVYLPCTAWCMADGILNCEMVTYCMVFYVVHVMWYMYAVYYM